MALVLYASLDVAHGFVEALVRVQELPRLWCECKSCLGSRFEKLQLEEGNDFRCEEILVSSKICETSTQKTAMLTLERCKSAFNLVDLEKMSKCSSLVAYNGFDTTENRPCKRLGYLQPSHPPRPLDAPRGQTGQPWLLLLVGGPLHDQRLDLACCTRLSRGKISKIGNFKI